MELRDPSRGRAGEAFVEALEAAVRVPVGAADGLVGATASGGSWELEPRGRVTAPLTAAGVAEYARVLATATWTGGQVGNWNSATAWAGGSGPNNSPGSGDTVIINQSGSSSVTQVTVTASPGLTFASITLGNAATTQNKTVTLVINSGTQLSVTGNVTVNSGAFTATISLAGGTLSAATVNLSNPSSSGSAVLTGNGTVSAAIATTSGRTNAASITATGGTLDLQGTITDAASLLALTVNANTDTLQFDVAGNQAHSLSFNSASGTLKLNGASAALTVGTGVTIGAGKVVLAGSGATFAAGASTITSGTISGQGVFNAALTASGAASITATGGTLEMQQAVTNGGSLALTVGSGASDKLLLDAASTATSLTFAGSTGTLELNTSGSLTLANTLTVGANTVKLDAPGGAVQFTDAAGILMTGGTFSGTGSLAANTNISGYGIVAISVSTAGALTAQDGGTLDLQGTVSNRTLSIVTGAANTLKISGTTTAAAFTINNSLQTLAISGSLTLTGTESITLGMISMLGGTLTDASGVVIGSGATLSGTGTVAASIGNGSTGIITALGGPLDITGAIGTGATGLQIAAGATLRLDSTCRVG